MASGPGWTKPHTFRYQVGPLTKKSRKVLQPMVLGTKSSGGARLLQAQQGGPLQRAGELQAPCGWDQAMTRGGTADEPVAGTRGAGGHGVGAGWTPRKPRHREGLSPFLELRPPDGGGPLAPKQHAWIGAQPSLTHDLSGAQGWPRRPTRGANEARGLPSTSIHLRKPVSYLTFSSLISF